MKFVKFSGMAFAAGLAVAWIGGCAGSTTQAKAGSDAPSAAQSGTQTSQSQSADSMAGMSKGSMAGSSGSGMAMNGVVNQEVGYVKNGVYVDKAGKPLCPVLGHEVASIKGAKFAIYKGVKYYFCCDSCPSEFAKHKDAYAYKPPKSAPAKK